MSRDISGSADTMDSRDIIERFEELESDRAALEEAIGEAREAREARAEAEEGEDHDDLDDAITEAVAALEEWDDAEEHAKLKALCEEGEGFSDWSYGAQLINEDYFTQYAEELATDICDMKNAQRWPFNHIDWDAAAEDLQQDYSTIEFDGGTFYIRG